jgi:hypothetical protein
MPRGWVEIRSFDRRLNPVAEIMCGYSLDAGGTDHHTENQQSEGRFVAVLTAIASGPADPGPSFIDQGTS